MQVESAIELSNQSKERALVGEVISTAVLADPISREFMVSDQGFDMEIVFHNDAHEATGAKLCLQLKSGDCRQCHATKWAAYSVSYTRKRRSDGAEIFTLRKQRHAEYWMAQAFPVLSPVRRTMNDRPPGSPGHRAKAVRRSREFAVLH